MGIHAASIIPQEAMLKTAWLKMGRTEFMQAIAEVPAAPATQLAAQAARKHRTAAMEAGRLPSKASAACMSPVLLNSQRTARCSALSMLCAPPCPPSLVIAVPQQALLHATSLRSTVPQMVPFLCKVVLTQPTHWGQAQHMVPY